MLDTLKEEDFTCNVVLVRSGVEALDYLLGRGEYEGRDTTLMPCAILLDLCCPGVLDGVNLLRELREEKRTKLLPIVAFTSSNDNPQQVNEIYTLGANSYIAHREEVGAFGEMLRQSAYYWCVLNEPPPNL
jgi:two-component system response regulator